MDLEKQFWDVYARLYMRLEDLVPYQELVVAVLAAIGTVDRGAVILDAGCGAGALLRELSIKFPDAKLIGIDRSKVMLDRARERLPPQVALHEGDLVLQFKGTADASVDVVVSTNVYYALDDPKAFLAEVRRVLAPGGRFVLVNPYVPDQTLIWRAHLLEVWRTRGLVLAMETLWNMPAYIAISMINALIARRARGRVYHFTPPRELMLHLQSNGFVVNSAREDLYGGTDCMMVASTATR